MSISPNKVHIYLTLRTNQPNFQFQTQQFLTGFSNFLNHLHILQQDNHGLSESQISNLIHKKAINSDSTCSICQDSILKFQDVICLDCRHDFHQACIVQWLKRADRCPLCRFQITRSRRSRNRG